MTVTSPYPSQPYQPQQGYPAQQPSYASQPGYPAQPQYQQPVQQGGFPPGTFQQPPPAQPVQPGPAVAPPSLREFMNQPAGGGNSLSFMQVGTRYSGTVIRTVTGADVDFAYDMQDRTKISKFNDGREKLILKVPILLDQPNAQYPDGTAIWVLKSNDRNELMRAMEAAGAQSDPELGFFRPQAGDWLSVTYTHDQPSRNGMNPRKVKAVEYRVGNGVPPQMPQAQVPQPVQYAQPQQQVWNPQVPGNTAWQQPQYQQNPVATPQPQPPQWAHEQLYQQANGWAPSNAPMAAAGLAAPQYRVGDGPHLDAPAPQPPQFDPAQAQQFQQQYQQPSFPQPQGGGFPPTQGAPAAQPGSTPGAPPTGPASPSNVPPPDWPADVPFVQGLTPAMARTAQALRVMNQQPQ
jgi:hypothetical protein